jgi:hypothetical protein
MVCPRCELNGDHPLIIDHGTESQCKGFFPFCDKAGMLHLHDSNQHITHYECSMGHQFDVVWYRVCECGWSGLNKE